MQRSGSSARHIDLVIVIFLAAVFMFGSPFLLLWTAPGTPWYVPYLIWAGVIGLALLADRLRPRDGV